MGPFSTNQQINNVYQKLGQGVPWYTNTSTPNTSVAAPAAPNPQTKTTSVSSNAPAVDPYAAFGGRQGLQDAKNSLYGNFNVGADKAAFDYETGTRDFLSQMTNNQNALNRQGAQNDLAKMQGRQGVLGMVNRGVASGQSMLANKNASDSSAAAAIANAYGKIGQGELSKVGNQYEMANEDLNLKQQEQNTQLTNKSNDLRRSKDFVVNDLVEKTRASIVALNAEMAGASVPDRIAVEQEIARLKNGLVSKLQAYDAQLAAAPSSIKANAPEDRRAEAQRLAGLGTAATNPFEFTTEAPVQMQGGANPSNMPLFTLNRNKRQG